MLVQDTDDFRNLSFHLTLARISHSHCPGGGNWVPDLDFLVLAVNIMIAVATTCPGSAVLAISFRQCDVDVLVVLADAVVHYLIIWKAERQVVQLEVNSAEADFTFPWSNIQRKETISYQRLEVGSTVYNYWPSCRIQVVDLHLLYGCVYVHPDFYLQLCWPCAFSHFLLSLTIGLSTVVQESSTS